MEGGEREEKKEHFSHLLFFLLSLSPLLNSTISSNVGRAAVSSFTAQETSAAEQSGQGLLAKGKVRIYTTHLSPHPSPWLG